jgi:UDP-glucose:(heptosyl)LPS alpha-1,3-glucosyltransferase
MSRLSLALIRQRYVEDGGAERFVARLLDALRRKGEVGVTLLTREWSDAKGFDVVALNPFFLGRIWRDWSFARSVCRFVKKRSFDLVQSHERIACCDIYRAGDGVHREWLAQRRRVLGWFGRFWLTLSPYHIYVRGAERRLFASPKLRAVICNSNMVKQEIKRYFGLADDKLHVIYSGVDTRIFHPRLKQYRAEIRARYAVPATATLFLFVGSGFERKGVAILLEAVAALPVDSYVIVVGRDKHSAHYAASAQALGLDTRVKFVGSQPDVKPFYGAADALVLPTLYDPFPNVVLEAMASGLPVVTSTKSGGAEFITDGRNGFVCHALDRAALSAALSALRDTKRRAAMCDAARAAAEPFDLERMASALRELYGRLAH